MKTKIAVISHVPAGIRFFLVNHIKSFSNQFDVTVLTNITSQQDNLDMLPDNIKKVDFPFQRQIRLVSDITALFKMLKLFYYERFTIIYSFTPKGSLLSMISGWCTGVPIRIHTFTGQVWLNSKGIYRFILKLMDRITATLATVVIVDSPSQREFLLSNRIIKQNKSLVFGLGSISGVDVKRFQPNPLIRKQIRHELGVLDATIVFLFIGRLKKEKGVFELAEAFSRLSKKHTNVNLWFVGTDEEKVNNKLAYISSTNINSIRFIPFTTKPENYMAAANVLCLPSHREGFGSVIIEAAACGIPTIGTNTYGITDAIINKKTGLLTNKYDLKGIEAAMKLLANNTSLRMKLGKAARKRVHEKFQQDQITDELMELLNKLLKKYV